MLLLYNMLYKQSHLVSYGHDIDLAFSEKLDNISNLKQPWNCYNFGDWIVMNYWQSRLNPQVI